MLKKSISGGPGTVKCKHNPHYSEKHENSILNVGDLTLTLINKDKISPQNHIKMIKSQKLVLIVNESILTHFPQLVIFLNENRNFYDHKIWSITLFRVSKGCYGLVNHILELFPNIFGQIYLTFTDIYNRMVIVKLIITI